MEQPELETKWRQLEHSFVLFIITISELGLSQEATALCMIPKAAELNSFIHRQRLRLDKPKGILLL